MILATTNIIKGKQIVKVHGLVQGSSVRTKHLGKDIFAGISNLIGGEVEEYAELLAESRDQAIERMSKQAEELGANAIVGMRLSTASISQGVSEVLAYGTAVQLK